MTRVTAGSRALSNQSDPRLIMTALPSLIPRKTWRGGKALLRNGRCAERITQTLGNRLGLQRTSVCHVHEGVRGILHIKSLCIYCRYWTTRAQPEETGENSVRRPGPYFGLQKARAPSQASGPREFKRFLASLRRPTVPTCHLRRCHWALLLPRSPALLEAARLLDVDSHPPSWIILLTAPPKPTTSTPMPSPIIPPDI